MKDVEDFDRVFQGLYYKDGLISEIQSFRGALGGRTFFERLLMLLKIKASKMYPPKGPEQLHELHLRIVTAETTLHNKHCLVFYLLKDLSGQHHEPTELSEAFAKDVHLEKRFWTFVEGLWYLDHFQFSTAVERLTYPSIIPTFPDEIMHTLLTGRDRLNSLGMSRDPKDDILALAYYNCVKPPLEDAGVRNEFAKYLTDRNVAEMYDWIHSRPEHEQKPLLEILIEQTLEKNAWVEGPERDLYTREAKCFELVSLPFTTEEEEFIEKFLTEGRGRTFQGAQDLVMMRRIATGKLADVAADAGIRGKRVDGINWEVLKDGVKRGLGPRKDEHGFSV
ncbi:ELYS domain containing protein [Pyrenophora tritici-repentis]|nr:ELYS domain containing protein [Pyrenophora tritici-repentis]